MVGVELAKHIRDLQALGELESNLKLVLISGDSIFSNAFKERLALFDDVLQKPFTIDQLRRLMLKHEYIADEDEIQDN
jgi:two-component SAPR family response regulator